MIEKHIIEKTLFLLEKYDALGVADAVDFQKFNQYLISHHSTHIEGSTLTYIETTVLLEDGLTPKGKPLVHSLMQKDHHEALLFCLTEAKFKPYKSSFIQSMNAKVMHTTGQIYNTPLGTVDGTKGEYRKGSVFAGQTMFVNFAKVPDLVEKLCLQINEGLSHKKTKIEQLQLAFEAHYQLVQIHPFYDGNGRTSRLLMNAIQMYFGLPLALVFTEDKVEYITALVESKAADDTDIFQTFMFQQYNKYLSNIIENQLMND